MVPNDVTCDDILTFDDEVAVTQDILTGEMIVEEMRIDESDTKVEEEKEDEQEADVSLMEKTNASQIREAFNSSLKHMYVECTLQNTCMFEEPSCSLIPNL